MKYLWDEITDIKKFLGVYDKIVLLLDFDGTLTPIVKPPNRAELSKSMRNLLIKLSKKQGFYLAILSGRTLKDIKKKIGLPNIIYGGNHGQEGEIFGKKYLFPVPDKALRALEKIQEQLNQVTGRFKGTFIQNKSLTLSFHYRLAKKQQVPEIKLLVNQMLKPYISKRLIAIIRGKKVIEITPNVNWNKGHFAALIVKKITDRIKTPPLAIVIGDDTTDEKAFQKLKKQITITVGKKYHSKAKYYIKNTKEVIKFLKLLNTINEKYFAKLRRLKNIVHKKDFQNPDFLEFWKGLIRDSTGRWLAYYYKGVKYFKYGKQSKPDLNDKLQLALIKSSIKHEQAFLSGLNNGGFKNLKQWLIKLHRKQSYFGTKGQILLKGRISQGEHSKMVIGSVLSLAQKYNDPYINKGAQVVNLPVIDPDGCPMDKWENKQVTHYYPDPKYFDQYLQIMKSKLEQFVLRSDHKVDKKTLEIIASYYQYGINMHMFENVNQSLFANQANAMLKLLGLKPVEHGILDFAAMRLQPKNFLNYFIDEVNYSA